MEDSIWSALWWQKRVNWENMERNCTTFGTAARCFELDDPRLRVHHFTAISATTVHRLLPHLYQLLHSNVERTKLPKLQNGSKMIWIAIISIKSNVFYAPPPPYWHGKHRKHTSNFLSKLQNSNTLPWNPSYSAPARSIEHNLFNYWQPIACCNISFDNCLKCYHSSSSIVSGIMYPVSPHMYWKFSVEINVKNRKAVCIVCIAKYRWGLHITVLDIYNQNFIFVKIHICVCMHVIWIWWITKSLPKKLSGPTRSL